MYTHYCSTPHQTDVTCPPVNQNLHDKSHLQDKPAITENQITTLSGIYEHHYWMILKTATK